MDDGYTSIYWGFLMGLYMHDQNSFFHESEASSLWFVTEQKLGADNFTLMGRHGDRPNRKDPVIKELRDLSYGLEV